ncbi:hypothetical protein AVEN_103779-1 [Araneus ventricosus]|uniref:Uncharacterized protein n=1 Tax=Araneus ventricosus TaxID=182803 RepID=A0A4Y2GJS7_ARAVE|nr:hypothetical protein AVEN_103779-1 [Araneus ventricosus]
MHTKCSLQKLPQRVASAEEMLSRIENERDFLNRIIFTDEATFHVINKVNISTTAEFGTQKIPMQYREWKERIQKSVCSALLHDTVIRQFFFAETSVAANIYLGMLQIYPIPLMQHLQLIVIFQQVAGA